MRARCQKCGSVFYARRYGDMYCKNCKNGHGSDREEDKVITEILDELHGFIPNKEDEDEEDDE